MAEYAGLKCQAYSKSSLLGFNYKPAKSILIVKVADITAEKSEKSGISLHMHRVVMGAIQTDVPNQAWHLYCHQ